MTNEIFEEKYNRDQIEYLADSLKRNNFIFSSKYNNIKHIWEAIVTIPRRCTVVYDIDHEELYIDFPHNTIVMCKDVDEVISSIKERVKCTWL